MSSAEEQNRPRRFATACDICNRRKVKCDGGQPCTNCAKRRAQCTYTRAVPDLHKPRRAARQLKVVTDRLRQVEDELAQARTDASVHAHSGQEQDNISILANLNGHADSDTDVLRYPVPHEILMVLELYFEQHDHFYPCFDKFKFINAVVQPASRQAGETPALRACVHAMMSIAFRMANFSESHDRTVDVDSKAEEHLTAALQDVHHLVAAGPSLLVVRALLCIVTSMSLSSLYTAQQASVLLASTCRAAQLLGLDGRSDELPKAITGYCIFSTLYVLDHDLSMQMRTAPLMQDKYNSFGDQILLVADRGSISNLEDTFNLGVFLANIKLSVIQDRIWTTLLSESSQSAARETRLTALDDIRAMLVTWTKTYLPPREMLNTKHWPATVYVHVVRVVLAYFFTLRTLFPDTFSSTAAIGRRLEALPDNDAETIKLIRENVSLPIELVDASRIAYTAVRSFGKAGLSWLRETLPVLTSATVVMYQSIIVEPDILAAQDRFDRAETALGILRQLGDPLRDELNEPIRVLMRLKQLAATAIELHAQR